MFDLSIGPQSTTKQKIYLPLYDQVNCVGQYRAVNSVVNGKQFCAGGINREDTCDGDSGNALVRIVAGSWIAEGIVSYGLGCGLPDQPGVYTKVTEFDYWIRSNLKP